MRNRITSLATMGVSLTMCLVLVMSVFLAVPAAAATSSSSRTNCSTDPIIAGLWAGVNLSLDAASYTCKNTAQNNTQSQTTSASESLQKRYVALGDSVAAGVGLSPRVANTDPACGVTGRAYAAHVASTLNLPYKNLACSGATAGDLVTEQHLSGTSRDIEPQLDRAFAGGTPKLITITAGANDVYWPYFLQKCYVEACGVNGDGVIVDGFISVMQVKLEYILANIYLRSNGHPPRVIFTGYYQPFSNTCTQQQTNVTKAEFNWIRNKTEAINKTIRDTVTTYSFARYVPVNFSGHELCTSSSWVQGVDDSAPFHPNAQGQRAIANAVLAQAR